MHDRFRRDLEALAAIPARIGVAVSGGPDSLALLVLAHTAFPGRVHAATVDHGLRPASAAEAAAVAEICGSLGVPHATLVATVPDGPAGLQAEARAARYAALAAWAEAGDIPLLLTAHHADDQAETVLMRLARGAGVGGLGGIRPVRLLTPHITLARPLLGWTRAELAAIVAAAGLTPIDDPSNADPRFDRTRIRTLLAAHPELAPARIARTAGAAREADAALDWQVEQLWSQCVTAGETGWLLDPTGLPRELVRRLLLRILGGMVGDIETLLATLERGGTATRAGFKLSGGARWRIAPTPPRSS